MTTATVHQPATEPGTASNPTACFAVAARAEPAVLPRVLEPFAKRGLVPTRWHATVCGTGAADLVIDIQVADLDPGLVPLIAAALRQIVGVDSVLTSDKRYARSA